MCIIDAVLNKMTLKLLKRYCYPGASRYALSYLQSKHFLNISNFAIFLTGVDHIWRSARGTREHAQ